MKMTLVLDANGPTENTAIIYNTFDYGEIVLAPIGALTEGSNIIIGGDVISSTGTGGAAASTGCYTVVVKDTGDAIAAGGTTAGLFNGASIKVEIGTTVMLNQVLAAANTRVEFEYKSFRFGTGCNCANGFDGYDIQQYHQTAETMLSSATTTTIFSYTIPMKTFFDTRICLNTCITVQVDGAPTFFKVTRVNGSNIAPDANDVRVADGAPSGPTMFQLGKNCCTTGQALVHQSFINVLAASTDVTRVLNTVSSTISTAATGATLTSECVSDPSSSCLKYAIPNSAGFTYTINVDDTNQVGTIATAGVDVKFGTTCDTGNVIISVTDNSSPGTSRIYVSDIVDFSAAAVTKDSSVLFESDGVKNSASQVKASVSPSGCYSFLVFNGSGDSNGQISYFVKFPVSTNAFSGSAFQFPQGSNPTYDMFRFGSACGCPSGFVPMDIQYLAPAGNTLAVTGTVTKTLTAAADYPLDTRTCVVSGVAQGLAFSASPMYASVTISDVEIIRSASSVDYTPFSCDAATEYQVTFSSTNSPSLIFNKQTIGTDTAAVVVPPGELCVPKAACTSLTFAGTLDADSHFIVAKDYATILASGSTLPTTALSVGDASCL